MKKFKQIIKIESSLFFSTKVPFIIFFTIYVSSLSLLLYFTYLDMGFYGISHTVSRFIYYIIIGFSFLLYYSLVQSQKNNVNEVVETTKLSHFKNTCIYMLLLIITWNIIIILILLFNATTTINIPYSIQYALQTYFYNCFMPQAIMITVAIFTAKTEKENIGFTLLAIFMLLTGPFFETMNWRIKPDIPIDIIIEQITKLFHIFYQNGEISPDTLYGLQLENRRIMIFVFWTIIFIIILLLKKAKNKKIIFIPVILLPFVFLQVYKDRSLYRISMDYKTGGYSDLYNYGFFEDKMSSYNKQKIPNFKVSQYTMNIDLDDKLYVSANVDIQAETPIQECIFTLYRGYKVSSIDSKYIHSFQQKEDQLIIKFKEKVLNDSLEITYQGYHPKYYSNECAAILPGYFPWYPMAGEKQIFIDFNGSYGMNVYNRIESCQFDISIQAHYPFITNLEEKNDKYSGISDSLTIIGGNLKKVESPIIRNILPLEYSIKDTEEDYIKNLESNLVTMDKTLRDIYHIDLELRDKKVIIASKDLSRNYSNNKITIFDNYILCSIDTLYNLNIYNVLEYYLTTPRYQGILKSKIIWASSEESFEQFQSNLVKTFQFEIDNNEQLLKERDPSEEGYKELQKITSLYKKFYTHLNEKNIRYMIQWLHEGYNDEDILKKLESGDYL